MDEAGDEANALGLLFTHEMEPFRKTKSIRALEERIATFVSHTTVLRNLRDTVNTQSPWLSILLANAFRNVPRPAKAVSTELRNFTETDARVSSQALPLMILTNGTPEVAVDEWILKYPALTQLSRQRSLCALRLPRL